MKNGYNAYIELIKNRIGEDYPFTLRELLEVGSDCNITTSLAYLRNIAGNLLRTGQLKKYGADKYILTTKNLFVPDISRKEILINADIKKNMPYSSICIWSLSLINRLSQHLINTDTVIVESEMDSFESSYFFLSGKYRNVYYSTDRNDNAYAMKSNVIVKKLVSQAPLQSVGKVKTITIEKLLVDLFVDKFFEPFQGYEIKHIYNNAFDAYIINLDRLYRYAGRQGKREEIEAQIKSLGYDRK